MERAGTGRWGIALGFAAESRLKGVAVAGLWRPLPMHRMVSVVAARYGSALF